MILRSCTRFFLLSHLFQFLVYLSHNAHSIKQSQSTSTATKAKQATTRKLEKKSKSWPYLPEPPPSGYPDLLITRLDSETEPLAQLGLGLQAHGVLTGRMRYMSLMNDSGRRIRQLEEILAGGKPVPEVKPPPKAEATANAQPERYMKGAPAAARPAGAATTKVPSRLKVGAGKAKLRRAGSNGAARKFSKGGSASETVGKWQRKHAGGGKVCRPP